MPIYYIRSHLLYLLRPLLPSRRIGFRRTHSSEIFALISRMKVTPRTGVVYGRNTKRRNGCGSGGGRSTSWLLCPLLSGRATLEIAMATHRLCVRGAETFPNYLRPPADLKQLLLLSLLFLARLSVHTKRPYGIDPIRQRLVAFFHADSTPITTRVRVVRPVYTHTIESKQIFWEGCRVVYIYDKIQRNIGIQNNGMKNKINIL